MMPLIAIVAALAFVVNVPLGALREHTRTFSWQWFLAIHAAVPFIAALRILSDVTMLVIPLLVILSIAGQVIGSRYRRRQLLRQAVVQA